MISRAAAARRDSSGRSSNGANHLIRGWSAAPCIIVSVRPAARRAPTVRYPAGISDGLGATVSRKRTWKCGAAPRPLEVNWVPSWVTEVTFLPRESVVPPIMRSSLRCNSRHQWHSRASPALDPDRPVAGGRFRTCVCLGGCTTALGRCTHVHRPAFRMPANLSGILSAEARRKSPLLATVALALSERQRVSNCRCPSPKPACCERRQHMAAR